MSASESGGISLPDDKKIPTSYIIKTQKAVDALATLDNISTFPPYSPSSPQDDAMDLDFTAQSTSTTSNEISFPNTNWEGPVSARCDSAPTR